MGDCRRSVRYRGMIVFTKLDSQARTLGTKCSSMGKAVFVWFFLLSPGFSKNVYLQTGCLWPSDRGRQNKKGGKSKAAGGKSTESQSCCSCRLLGRISLEREDGGWFQIMVDPLQLKGMLHFWFTYFFLKLLTWNTNYQCRGLASLDLNPTSLPSKLMQISNFGFLSLVQFSDLNTLSSDQCTIGERPYI